MTWHTTKVETQDGAVYDLGRGQYPPSHAHPGWRSCAACLVIDAWNEAESLKSLLGVDDADGRSARAA